MIDVLVVGAGPSGVLAALRAADLGAHTVLVTRTEFGGMAANDGPVPVRTLAHAARLIREARQLDEYGIGVGEPVLDYPRLLARVREVVNEVRAHSSLRPQIDSLGVTVHEHVGVARFADEHTITTESGLRLQAEKIIICTGGVSRRLSVPMLIVGAGATGVQVASIFNAFGSRIQLFQTGPRILPTEDEDVSAAVAAAFRGANIAVHENIGAIEAFEKTPAGVRMIFSRDGVQDSAEATLAVVAVGWVADTARLSLATGGVETDHRGFVRVNEHLRTSAPHIFAAGDITGRLMLVPQAVRDGFVAATNAVRGSTMTIGDPVSPIGSFTDPEYAQVGLTEAKARKTHEVETALIRFDSTTRTIIDGHKVGFCKLIVDRNTSRMLGCHVVGERAVEIAQLAGIVIAAGMRVDNLAHIPLSFPTYAGILARVAASAARKLNLNGDCQVNQAESTW
jgi:pyruvate/2-oxoglutarate dehydrogenase complex dihydrolipoamide dehydrogenase (E3) component